MKPGISTASAHDARISTDPADHHPAPPSDEVERMEAKVALQRRHLADAEAAGDENKAERQRQHLAAAVAALAAAKGDT
jgi:hypothetical protein